MGVIGGGCGQLLAPENGRVEVSSNKVGGTATYYCDDGYELVGDDTRVCRASGLWAGTMPFCRGRREGEEGRGGREEREREKEFKSRSLG